LPRIPAPTSGAGVWDSISLGDSHLLRGGGSLEIPNDGSTARVGKRDRSGLAKEIVNIRMSGGLDAAFDAMIGQQTAGYVDDDLPHPKRLGASSVSLLGQSTMTSGIGAAVSEGFGVAAAADMVNGTGDGMDTTGFGDLGGLEWVRAKLVSSSVLSCADQLCVQDIGNAPLNSSWGAIPPPSLSGAASAINPLVSSRADLRGHPVDMAQQSMMIDDMESSHHSEPGTPKSPLQVGVDVHMDVHSPIPVPVPVTPVSNNFAMQAMLPYDALLVVHSLRLF